MLERYKIGLVLFHLGATIIAVSYLDVSTWVDPHCCTLSCWFRYTVLSYSTIVMLTYFIFSYLFFFKWRDVFGRLTGNFDFGDSLAIVFFLCALCHACHGFSYLSKYVKPSALFFYPPLIFYHIRLILMSNKVANRLRTIKTSKEYDKLKNELVALLHHNTIITVAKFKKGHEKVYFDDLASITKDIWIQFVPGCDVILRHSDQQKYEIDCIMTPLSDGKPSELETHEHPDCTEEFFIQYGELHDRISGVIIKEGERYTFEAGQLHNPVCYVKTAMKITGRKVTNKNATI